MKNNDKQDSELIIPSVVTGRLMFQFDNDEAHHLFDIVNNGEFTLTIKGQDKEDKTPAIALTNNSDIAFKSKEGKTFSLFIENALKQKQPCG